jgi:single-strand DNA-binding protein
MLSGTIVGNLGGDPIKKQVGQGSVLEFSIASTKKIKGEEHTTWVRCQYWNEKAADAVLPYLKKGGMVACSGDLELRAFTKKTGEQAASLEMRVNSVKLCGSREGGGRSAAPPSDNNDAGPVDNSDVPF